MNVVAWGGRLFTELGQEIVP